jgi:hypothetical protein
MDGRSKKTGNVLSEIGSQGIRKKRLRSGFSETDSKPSGIAVSAGMTLRPGTSHRKAGKNGQLEGSAVKGKTGKP